MSEALTVLLPTYGRNDFLERQLAHLVRHPLPVSSVIIADDNPEEQRAENAALVARFSNDIPLRHLVFKERLSLIEKLALGMDAVDSPLVLVGSDDDFFVPETVAENVRVMEEDASVSAALGRAAWFTFAGHEVYGDITLSKTYRQRPVDGASAGARLIANLDHYSTCWYSVQRTDACRQRWHTAVADGLDVLFAELLTSCMTAVDGRIHCSDQLFMVRQGDLSKDYFMASPADLFAEEEFSARYRRWRDRLTAHVCAKEGGDEDAVKAEVGQAFLVFIRTSLLRWISSPILESQQAEATGWRRFLRGSGGLGVSQVAPDKNDPCRLENVRNTGNPFYKAFAAVEDTVGRAPATGTEGDG